MSVPDGLSGTAGFAWKPDGSAILMSKEKGDGMELWLVPVNGDGPRKLDIDASDWARDSGFCLHPDGRQIAFVAGKREMEVWALEDFLPASK